jgi:hypothetical protein
MKTPSLSLWDKIKLARLASNTAMLEKLKSRKLWAAVVGSVIVALGDQLGLDKDTTLKIAAIVGSYVIGQGLADGAGR